MTKDKCICSTFVHRHFAQELPKTDFQDQLIALNFGNILLNVLKKINDFKFLRKEKRRRFSFVDNGGQSSRAL